jgi:hypothetical protein
VDAIVVCHVSEIKAQRVVRSEEEQRSSSGRRTERDLKQERQRRRQEEAEAARQQSERVAAQEQEIWMARVRAVLASMTWKSGRRRKRSAARAVVGAERVGGGEAAAARAPSTKRGRTPEPDAKQGQLIQAEKRSVRSMGAAILLSTCRPCEERVRRGRSDRSGEGQMGRSAMWRAG